MVEIKSGGQVIIHVHILKKLGLKEGSYVAFVEEGGTIYLANTLIMTLAIMREGFKGEAERLGLKDEQDVVALVKEVREEIRKERYKNND